MSARRQAAGEGAVIERAFETGVRLLLCSWLIVPLLIWLGLILLGPLAAAALALYALMAVLS